MKEIQIEPERLRELYQAHASLDDLAAHLGVGKMVLRRALDAAGIEVRRGRKTGCKPSGGRPARLPDSRLEEIVAMYEEHGSMSPVAAAFGVTRQAVSQFFARHGVDVDRRKPLPGREEVVEAWCDSRNATDVANALRIAIGRAREALEVYGLTFPSIAATPRQVEDWSTRYRSGTSAESLAEEVGVHVVTMKRALREAGVELRDGRRKDA